MPDKRLTVKWVIVRKMSGRVTRPQDKGIFYRLRIHAILGALQFFRPLPETRRASPLPDSPVLQNTGV